MHCIAAVGSTKSFGACVVKQRSLPPTVRRGRQVALTAFAFGLKAQKNDAGEQAGNGKHSVIWVLLRVATRWAVVAAMRHALRKSALF
jgi:hypothetical protein